MGMGYDAPNQLKLLKNVIFSFSSHNKRQFYTLFILMRDFNQQPEIDMNRYLKYMGIVTCAIALSNPIELVKTRLQISPQLLVKKTIDQPYTTVTNTFQRVVKEEGFRGLFKGVQYFLMRTLPSNMGVFTVKQLIHRYLTKSLKTANPESQIRKQLEKHFVIVNGAIGSLAGLAIQVSIYPFDYFRIILSNEIKSHPDFGIVKCIKQAMHTKGVRGIFNGVMINLVYMSAARGVYFGIYDSYKHDITNELGKIILSYFSLCFALFINFPLDTIRKRVIVSKNRHKNARECFKHIWNEEKLVGLYHGWRVVTLQAGAFCILYYLYDIMFTEIFRSNTKQ